tara:strand:- start:72 stop:374 length:303 start_codon:yes stop_codon:yes gene_type:complete
MLLAFFCPTLLLVVYYALFVKIEPCNPNLQLFGSITSGAPGASPISNSDPAQFCPNWDFLLTWDDESNYVSNDNIKAFTVPNLLSWFTAVKINVYEVRDW